MKQKLSSQADWQSKVKALRVFLALSQQEFGRRLGTTAMSVSRWERGQAEPPADAYIRMGNIAGDPMCWYFWERAGLSVADVKRVLPSAQQRHARVSSGDLVRAGMEKVQGSPHTGFVSLPFFPLFVGTPGEFGDNEADIAAMEPETSLAAPNDWCPNPESTICLRVKGNSMSPLILDGYIIAVDTANVGRDALVGEIVVARHVKYGLLLSRLIRFEHLDVLVSDHREYSSVSVAKDSDWKLVGKVLWWTGRPPQQATATEDVVTPVGSKNLSRDFQLRRKKTNVRRRGNKSKRRNREA